MPNVNIKKLKETAILPTYGSEHAAGCDLYACICSDLVLAPGQTVLVPTGLAMEIPVGYVGLIFARSGLATKQGLAPANKVGVIDSDYRGEIMVALHNHSQEERTIENGERVAQMVMVPYIKAEWNEVDDLEDTARGAGGFGSTGTK